MMKIVPSITALVLLMTAAACGKKSEPNTTPESSAESGATWEVSPADPASRTSADGIVGKWRGAWGGMDVSYEFRPDNTLHVVTTAPVDGAYQVNGDEVTMNFSGSRKTSKFKLGGNGDTLVLSADGVDITLKRAR
ncbi:MAG: hypothetical protein LBM04_09410 [Opitutaceae bacterium]|nr:hypothetical protein [Opitutaceae bacterium]